MKKILLWILMASIFITTGCSYIEHSQGADTNQGQVENDIIEDTDPLPTQEAKQDSNLAPQAKNPEQDSSQMQKSEDFRPNTSQTQESKDLEPNDSSPEQVDNTDKEVSKLKVHFIDVGQGDSVLIESDNKYMLIDAGERNKSKVVIDYLENIGVKKLDYLIATHPHSDHIGGLADVIGYFDIGKVIMPDVVHTTKTFEDLLDAISEKNLKITKAVVGNVYNIGDASFVIIAPNKNSYDNLNNYSVGIKLQNGANSFLFTGDAEVKSENEMLQNGINLDADVLKLGHHGSSTSNSHNFLDAVTPDIAIISVGEGNSYGHPHAEVLQTLNDRNIKLYRTDKQGTIILESDGNTITSNYEPYTISDADLKSEIDNKASDKKEASSYTDKSKTEKANVKKETSTEAEDPKNIIVHITKTGSKYHRANCRHLKSDIEVTLKEALSKGLSPCKTCNPPTL